MSLTEKQQMKLDTESATHSGMEGQSRCSHKYLLLQVWCGLLTVAMVIMAAFLTSIKTKSTEIHVPNLTQDSGSNHFYILQDQGPTLKPDNVSPAANTRVAPLRSIGSSFSYIQLIKDPSSGFWTASFACDSCPLILRNDSIYCQKDSVYFINAQVTFSKKNDQSKSVILIKNDLISGTETKLVEGTFPNTTEGTVWVAKIVSLKMGDRVILNIEGDILKDNTFWGAFELH